MVKPIEIIEDVLIATGITISLSDIHQILSIIILVVDVVWILFKCGLKIYQKIKEKKYSEIAEDIKTASEELKELDNQINESKDSKGDK